MLKLSDFIYIFLILVELPLVILSLSICQLTAALRRCFVLFLGLLALVRGHELVAELLLILVQTVLGVRLKLAVQFLSRHVLISIDHFLGRLGMHARCSVLPLPILLGSLLVFEGLADQSARDRALNVGGVHAVGGVEMLFRTFEDLKNFYFVGRELVVLLVAVQEKLFSLRVMRIIISLSISPVHNYYYITHSSSLKGHQVLLLQQLGYCKAHSENKDPSHAAPRHPPDLQLVAAQSPQSPYLQKKQQGRNQSSAHAYLHLNPKIAEEIKQEQRERQANKLSEHTSENACKWRDKGSSYLELMQDHQFQEALRTFRDELDNLPGIRLAEPELTVNLNHLLLFALQVLAHFPLLALDLLPLKLLFLSAFRQLIEALQQTPQHSYIVYQLNQSCNALNLFLTRYLKSRKISPPIGSPLFTESPLGPLAAKTALIAPRCGCLEANRSKKTLYCMQLHDRSKTNKTSFTNSINDAVPFMQKRFFAAIPQTRLSLQSRILPVIRSRIRSVQEERTETVKSIRSNFLLPINPNNKTEKTIDIKQESEEQEVIIQPKKQEKQPEIQQSLKFLKYKFQPAQRPAQNVDLDYGQYKTWTKPKTITDLEKEEFVIVNHPKSPRTFREQFKNKYP